MESGAGSLLNSRAQNSGPPACYGSDALSKEPDPRTRESFLYDDYQIESSTDEARVKSGASVDDTQCVMVSDKLCPGTSLLSILLLNKLRAYVECWLTIPI
jgi:hypothetical protein